EKTQQEEVEEKETKLSTLHFLNATQELKGEHDFEKVFGFLSEDARDQGSYVNQDGQFFVYDKNSEEWKKADGTVVSDEDMKGIFEKDAHSIVSFQLDSQLKDSFDKIQKRLDEVQYLEDLDQLAKDLNRLTDGEDAALTQKEHNLADEIRTKIREKIKGGLEN